MQSSIERVLAVHIVFAIGCAIAFWPPLLTAKGGRVHVRIGKLYSVLLVLMIATALTVTALSFMSADEQAKLPARGMLLDPFRGDKFVYRTHLSFLAFIAIGTVQALAFGLSSLRVERKPRAALVHASLALVGIGIAAMGIVVRFPPMTAVALAGLALGVFCAARCVAPREALRLPDHLTGLIASGVLSYSAIAVVVATRIIPDFFRGPYGIIVWLLPTLIGLPTILVLRRRFSGLSSLTDAASPASRAN